MKGFLILLAGLSLFVSSAAEATANLKLHCLSVMILPATADDPQFGLEYNLEITTGGGTDPANGEIMLAPEDVPYTHEGVFLLEDPTIFEKIPMPFFLDVPVSPDANDNGVPDFFEVESANSGRTTGIYQDWDGSIGDFSADWIRDADNPLGTVVLTFPEFGLTFRHTYVLFQYNGTYTHTRSGNQVIGTVSVARADNPPDTLQGPWTLYINAANGLNWTNAVWQDPSSFAVELSGSGSMTKQGLVFSDIFFASDGYPATAQVDYDFWFVVLTSPDTNGNSIPDLVEGEKPADPPQILAVKKDGQLELQITGTTGQAYTLQRVDALPAATAQWTTVQSVTLGANPTVVSLPLGTGNAFFRLQQ